MRTWLTCKACYIRGEYFSNVNLSLPATQGLVGWVATNAQAMHVQDIADNAAGYPETNVYAYLASRSLLAVPLLARDTTIGVLELSNLPDDISSDVHKALVETLAASATVAIDNAHLVETLRQQTLDLQTQNEDLDAFAHTVAHDLKNPISLILGYATLLADDCSDSPNKTQYEFAHQIMKGSRKMTNIIDELL